MGFATASISRSEGGEGGRGAALDLSVQCLDLPRDCAAFACACACAVQWTATTVPGTTPAQISLESGLSKGVMARGTPLRWHALGMLQIF